VRRLLPALIVATLVAACSGTGADDPTTTVAAEGCADVVAAEATPEADGAWRFEVTVASADTGWEKYADAWEVRLPDGTVVGTRELAHPHVDEQPFTRSLAAVPIPDAVGSVTVAARDSVAGFCGSTLEVALGR
jgi:hypothetical protein